MKSCFSALKAKKLVDNVRVVPRSQEAQTELVMLILLRLAEDVITFQTLPTQRRRDIQQTLTQNMDNIFSFMLAILHINAEDYRKVVRGS